MNADQRLEQLFQRLANYERSRSLPAAWSLEPTRVLLAGLVPGPLPGRWVQVAGSKGKGTAVAYLEALGRAAGLRVGAFVSPHLQHVTERVRIDGEPVGADPLAAAMERVLAVAAAQGVAPSFFEAITVAAVVLFAAADLDLVALEVGLGGRLDATTAVPVDGNIVTRIELEHTEILGDTVALIAAEKAHTMRPGCPVWFLPDPAVAPVLRAHAERVGAIVAPVPELVEASVTAERWHGELRLAGQRWPVAIEGGSAFERPALALAFACLHRWFPERRFTLAPVARPRLPGRFEVRGGDPPMVLDGAHTPESSAMVAAELRRRFPGRPVVVLFASAVDKRWREGLSAFFPIADSYFVTSLEGTIGVAPGEVVAWLRQQGKTASEVGGPAAGLAALSDCPAVRLVVGSFYLVGAVRALLVQSHE